MNKVTGRIQAMNKVTGRMHSVETCGAVDGPGLRFVIFLQGCPVRCQYCHNVDTRPMDSGKEVSVEELLEEIKLYRSFMNASHGGVTISGGEPLAQVEFVEELCKRCQEIGIHTVLDTSGFYKDFEKTKSLLKYVDLVLLDIKSFDPTIYKTTTEVDIKPTLAFAEYLKEIKKETWMRFVLVPNLTDDPKNIEDLAKYVGELDNVSKVEVQPFHKMGESKWDLMGYENKLKHTPPPTYEMIQNTINVFKKYHSNVH